MVLVASIAVADLINPSTFLPALRLANAPSGRGLASFTLGVLAVHLAGGLVLVPGPGPALISELHHVRAPVEHALQAAGGVIARGFAVLLWRSRGAQPRDARTRRSDTRASAFALGAGIMAIQLPTAFVYFGAIAARGASRDPPPRWRPRGAVARLRGGEARRGAQLAVAAPCSRWPRSDQPAVSRPRRECCGRGRRAGSLAASRRVREPREGMPVHECPWLASRATAEVWRTNRCSRASMTL